MDSLCQRDRRGADTPSFAASRVVSLTVERTRHRRDAAGWAGTATHLGVSSPAIRTYWSVEAILWRTTLFHNLPEMCCAAQSAYRPYGWIATKARRSRCREYLTVPTPVSGASRFDLRIVWEFCCGAGEFSFRRHAGG
ncbi:hypothetical protein GCM10011610_45850 [Nocardia rhizosphaerihabitans]|uniref:Uncharacterized protein n=1 Tax=Nocardia rhizosphaerihabitans TaxID=1691570 RepID=A0ABQ2KP73_9NOCA|nr:hypothetical protein GCM10011610_45850 [Nocardia rhizosphaerihabitans]